MTYKWRKRGLWKWARYEYEVLDDVVDLNFTSPVPLEPKECDVIFDSVKRLNVFKGELKTNKGRIFYNYNPKTWTDDTKNNR